jgi:Domain of unknown function (DUF4279)
MTKRATKDRDTQTVIMGVTVRVWGDFDPIAFALLISLQPTYTHHAGDRVSTRVATRHPHSMWMFEREESSDGPDRQLAQLLELLPAPSVWRAAVGDARSDIYCVVRVNGDMCGFEISADALSQLGSYSLAIGFDIDSSVLLEDVDDTTESTMDRSGGS